MNNTNASQNSTHTTNGMESDLNNSQHPASQPASQQEIYAMGSRKAEKYLHSD